MKQYKYTTKQLVDAERFLAMSGINASRMSSAEMIEAAGDIAEHDRRAMAKLYAEKSDERILEAK